MFSTGPFCRCAVRFLSATAFVSASMSAYANPVADGPDQRPAAVRAAISVQDEATPSLMQQSEILGPAVGVADDGNPVLKVYVNREATDVGRTIRNLPGQIRGTPVQVELMDEIRAMGNTQQQTLPISLGTSGGWTYGRGHG